MKSLEERICEYSASLDNETDLRLFIGYLAKCVDGVELKRFYPELLKGENKLEPTVE